MTRALIFIGTLKIIFSAACSPRLADVDVPDAPTFTVKHSAPPNMRLCVPLETFIDGGVGCITVRELRALLRSRRDVAIQMDSQQAGKLAPQ